MSQRHDARRVVELRVLPVLIALSVVLPIPVAGELPDPIATHWDASGTPNGSLPLSSFWLGASVVWLGFWVLLDRRSRNEPARRGARMPEAITILAIGGFLAGVMIATTVANRGETGWRDADVAGFILVVPILSAAGLAAAAAWWCERGRPWTVSWGPAARHRERPTVALGRDERAVWVGRAKSGRMLSAGIALGVGLFAASLLAVASTTWQLLVPVLIAAIALIWASEVTVTVAAKGVRVAFGPLNTPSRFVALEKIETAEAIDVDPLRWGGWGYRWAGPGRIAVVVRRGPGILIRTRDGRTLVVTVDGASQAAGLLNDLIARRTGTGET